MDLLIVLGFIGAVATVALALTKRENPCETSPQAADEAPEGSAEFVRAEITAIRHDLDPATLKRWSSVTCRCEDGETRQMSFQGENGTRLLKGDVGTLEHRQGSFVSFTKDTGEVVGILYHIPPETEDAHG